MLPVSGELRRRELELQSLQIAPAAGRQEECRHGRWVAGFQTNGLLLVKGIDEASLVRLCGRPTAVAYGTVTVGQAVSRSVTATNCGTAGTLTGSVDIVNTSPGGNFPVPSGGNAYSLGPGGSRVVTVEFRPLQTGAASATLRIMHNAANASSPIDVPLTGTSQ
jgi:hypothetical protein